MSSWSPWASLRDVQQREQEDPNDVDEVPIVADQLDALEFAVLTHVEGDDRHDHDSPDDVEAVKTRSDVVKGPERVRRDREPVSDLAGPFDGLHYEERQTAEE